MAKYQFVINADISLGIEVEADTLAEAITRAMRAPVRTPCAHCMALAPCSQPEWGLGRVREESTEEEFALEDFHGGHGEPWRIAEAEWERICKERRDDNAGQ